jgi:hypothetical protein
MNTRTLAFFGALLLGHFVFAQENRLLKYLPSEASMIMSFNPVSIAKKVPGENFRQSFLYRELMKNESNGLKNFLDDPSSIGVDFSHDLLLVINDANTGEEGPGFFISGMVKDQTVFSNTIKNLKPNNKPLVVPAGDNKINIIAHDGMAIAWNTDAFVFTNGMSGEIRKQMLNEMPAASSDDSETITETKLKEWETKMIELQEKMNKMLVDYCTALFSQGKERRFLNNAPLAELMRGNADIRMWTNGSSFGNQLNKMPPIFASFLGKLDTKMASEKISVVNFENGKISGYTKSYLNPELDALYKIYPTGKLNTALIQKLPDSDIMALFAFSANPGMTGAWMKHMGLGELVDSFKSKIPFDPKLLSSSFGSDIMLAVMKASSKENKPADMVAPVAITDDAVKVEGSAEQKSRGPLAGMDLVLAIPVSNPENFKQLREAAGKFIDSVRKTEEGEKILGKNPPVIKFNDKYCVLALNEKFADAFLNKEPSGKIPDWLATNSDSPMLMSIHFKELLSFLNKSFGKQDKPFDESFTNAIQTFDRMNITGGNYSGGALHSSVEFRFSNPGENAMKQLFDFMNIAIEESMKAKREVRIEGIKDEEVAIPPPPAKKPKTKTKN